MHVLLVGFNDYTYVVFICEHFLFCLWNHSLTIEKVTEQNVSRKYKAFVVIYLVCVQSFLNHWHFLPADTHTRNVSFSENFVLFGTIHLVCMQHLPKTNISYPLIHIRTCAYQGVRNVSFSDNLRTY